jgi:hypothetical protein
MSPITSGMNPKKLGKLDNHDQEPWKMPLRQYIEHLYFKRFGKERPDEIPFIEEKIRHMPSKLSRLLCLGLSFD